MENPKIWLYPEMVLKVFELCCEKAKINPNNKGFLYRLGRLLRDKYHISEDIPHRYPDFLKNTYWKSKEAAKDPILNQVQTGRLRIYMLPMIQFADIEDVYEEMNRKFRRDKAAFVFTPKPFTLLNFLRLTHTAELISGNNSWRFKHCGREYAGGKIDEIKLFTMPGDRYPRWLQISYTSEGQPMAMYFAEYEEGKLKIQNDSTALYRFFNVFL